MDDLSLDSNTSSVEAISPRLLGFDPDALFIPQVEMNLPSHLSIRRRQTAMDEQELDDFVLTRKKVKRTSTIEVSTALAIKTIEELVVELGG